MATVPVEITWVTGQVVSAAQLNTNVRDAINFLLSPPFCVARQTAAQSLATGAWVAILLDTNEIDRDAGHSTTTNTSRYVCKTTGWYQIDATVAIATNATGMRAAALYVNGTSRPGRQSWLSPSGGSFTTAVPISGSVYLNVNDYLEVYGFQASGGALNTAVDAGSALTVRWVST